MCMKNVRTYKRFLFSYDLWWINEMKPYNNSQIYELNFTLVRWNGDDFLLFIWRMLLLDVFIFVSFVSMIWIKIYVMWRRVKVSKLIFDEVSSSAFFIYHIQRLPKLYLWGRFWILGSVFLKCLIPTIFQ